MMICFPLFFVYNSENLPYDMVARPAATSPGLWQRRTVDLLLDALVLLREDMDTPNEDDVQRVSKRKCKINHALFKYWWGLVTNAEFMPYGVCIELLIIVIVCIRPISNIDMKGTSKISVFRKFHYKQKPFSVAQGALTYSSFIQGCGTIRLNYEVYAYISPHEWFTRCCGAVCCQVPIKPGIPGRTPSLFDKCTGVDFT